MVIVKDLMEYLSDFRVGNKTYNDKFDSYIDGS